MSTSSSIPNSVQEGNRLNVQAQVARPWDVPKNPHDPRTTAAADWQRQAKDAGLI